MKSGAEPPRSSAWRAVALALAASLAGCEDTPLVYSGADDGWIGRAHMPEVAADPASPAAFDPHLDGFEAIELRFALAHASGARCTVELSRGGVALGVLPGTIDASACTAAWSGRDAGGALVSPGIVDATAIVTRGADGARATMAVEVLRVGVAEVQLEGPGRAPLLYAALDGLRYGYFEHAATDVPWRLGPDVVERGGVALEHADGTPRAPPAPWDDTASPPLDGESADGVEHDTFSLPTAWIAGSTLEAAVRFSTATASGVGPALVELRVVAPDGLALLDPPALEDDARLRFESTRSPVPAVGRYDVAYGWRFEARRGPSAPWTPIPGRFTTTHRLYGLVAAPTFGRPEVPHRAWVDVVDRVAGWVDGASADADAVGARIVEGIYYELGLSYDRQSGASHYTNHPGGFERATFELSRFRDLANGAVINCSDAASIVSTYANMVGIDLRYHIIQHRTRTQFELHYLAAIGFDFAASPFLSGRSAFRYHAIVGPPDTRVLDATLALDGDTDPSRPPHEVLLVQGLAQADYLARLTPEADQVRVWVDEKVTIR
ncbi:MAG: hypothetical protein KF729_04795 [Sandaracinaceae bacterium]|nr:hypothetical protein [Sandaracinaceae bacterium]